MRAPTQRAADDPAPGETREREADIRDVRRAARAEIELERQLLQERRIRLGAGLLFEAMSQQRGEDLKPLEHRSVR